jgi:hypothetical protein
MASCPLSNDNWPCFRADRNICSSCGKTASRLAMTGFGLTPGRCTLCATVACAGCTRPVAPCRLLLGLALRSYVEATFECHCNNVGLLLLPPNSGTVKERRPDLCSVQITRRQFSGSDKQGGLIRLARKACAINHSMQRGNQIPRGQFWGVKVMVL